MTTIDPDDTDEIQDEIRHLADERPVNEVYLSDSWQQWIVLNCVICGGEHYHGRDATVALGGRSTRAAHCTDQGGEYYLELADDEELPERFLTWVRDDRPEVNT